MSITPSHIIQYLYCPRFIYFEHVLRIPQFEEDNYKVMRGRRLHDERLARNKGYLRKRLKVVKRYDDQYLTNAWLRGRVDEVLKLPDGTYAPLDYKFAEYKDRIFSTYRTQLYCYAWLISDNFAGAEVKRGYLVYTRSNNKLVEVPIAASDQAQVRRCAQAVVDIIGQNYFPKATKDRRKCLSCTYRKLCVR
ncbi:MAG: CRISPR-associated protein Cas4 [Bacteroidetes bacterium]|nr:MAG: CRISPR-associated protein Cas4 [Bacteroidota bacterium]